MAGFQTVTTMEEDKFELVREAIDAAALVRHVRAGQDGAIVTFDGFVRNESHGRETSYLEYEAFLSTTDSSTTPSIQSVQACFDDLVVTSLAVAPASGTEGGTVDLSATLTASGSASSSVISQGIIRSY